MTRILIIAALLLSGGLAFQTWRADGLRTALAQTQADLTAAQNAARVLGTYYATLEAERIRWAAIEVQLDQLEGADEPLSDYGRAVLDSVRNP